MEQRVVVRWDPERGGTVWASIIGVVRCPRAMSLQGRRVFRWDTPPPPPCSDFGAGSLGTGVSAGVVFHLYASQGPGARGFNIPSPEPRFAAARPLNYLQITGGRIISLGGVLILSYGALIKTFFLCKDIPQLMSFPEALPCTTDVLGNDWEQQMLTTRFSALCTLTAVWTMGTGSATSFKNNFWN